MVASILKTINKTPKKTTADLSKYEGITISVQVKGYCIVATVMMLQILLVLFRVWVGFLLPLGDAPRTISRFYRASLLSVTFIS
jgi:hypothetical protein